ncbi:MAG: DUF1552 domain-containing protein, partial [Myxococcales bacterium]|nr:DUF1552 domain-containing protein [Myxococcales bacterium]
IHPRPTSASIDQHIARATAPAGKLPSVVWGQATGRFGSQFGYAIDADGSWVPVESSPSSAYGRLVDNGLSATDPTPGPTPVEPTRAERIAAMRARMLGVAAADFDRVVPTLGDEDDRRRLARHAESIRALETRWTVGPGGGPIPTPAACDPRFDADGDRMDAFFRLTALALSCDVTRVVSLNLPQLRSAEFGAPPTEDVHERYAHGTDAESVRWMGLYYRYHASQFASLVSYLAAMPDGDGTLLDSTMVVWVPELATGNHGFNDAFAMVAGGRATGLQLGRYTRFAQNRPTLCSAYGCRGEGIGPGHSHLYVSAMQHMGMSEDVFGRRTGRAQSGATIDLGGPLPFLRG